MSSSGSRKETIFTDEQVYVSTYETSIILADATIPYESSYQQYCNVALYTVSWESAVVTKNAWVDSQGRVYFIYPIHQIAVDMNKSETTIKDVMRELVTAQLLEKIPEGRGRPNRLYILFPDAELGQKYDGGKLTPLGQKTDLNNGGISNASKYKSKNTSNLLRDYDYEEEESFKYG